MLFIVLYLKRFSSVILCSLQFGFTDTSQGHVSFKGKQRKFEHTCKLTVLVLCSVGTMIIVWCDCFMLVTMPWTHFFLIFFNIFEKNLFFCRIYIFGGKIEK